MSEGAAAGAILPGATIGFLGGGQLGRMTAFAARSMGYDVAVFDPDPDCPMVPVSSHVVTAPYSDHSAAAAFAERCDVVTLEIEQIPRLTLEAVASRAPLRPGVEPVFVIQDRGRQKEWLRDSGFPVGDFRVVTNEESCMAAAHELGDTAAIVKSCFGGYDGRGQARIAGARQAAAAWRTVGATRCVIEAFVEIAHELSVLVARGPDGACTVFPPSRNHHDGGMLAWAVMPTGLPEQVEWEAERLGREIARQLEIVGLIAVELFLTVDGRLLVNELAPRPHNTFHTTERACRTNQFEQLVRAICGLPHGAPALVTPGAIANLLGGLWEGDGPDVLAALSDPEVRVHLYGKRLARPGRKMGHLSATGATADAALERVLRAYAAFARDEAAFAESEGANR